LKDITSKQEGYYGHDEPKPGGQRIWTMQLAWWQRLSWWIWSKLSRGSLL